MTPREQAEELVAMLDDNRFTSDMCVAAIERAIIAATDEAVKNAIFAQREKPLVYGEIVVTAENYARNIEEAKRIGAEEAYERAAKVVDGWRAFKASDDMALAIRGLKGQL